MQEHTRPSGLEEHTKICNLQEGTRYSDQQGHTTPTGLKEKKSCSDITPKQSQQQQLQTAVEGKQRLQWELTTEQHAVIQDQLPKGYALLRPLKNVTAALAKTQIIIKQGESLIIQDHLVQGSSFRSSACSSGGEGSDKEKEEGPETGEDNNNILQINQTTHQEISSAHPFQKQSEITPLQEAIEQKNYRADAIREEQINPDEKALELGTTPLLPQELVPPQVQAEKISEQEHHQSQEEKQKIKKQSARKKHKDKKSKKSSHETQERTANKNKNNRSQPDGHSQKKSLNNPKERIEEENTASAHNNRKNVNLMQEIIAKLKKRDFIEPFLSAVDEERDGAPNYYAIIKKPIDLEKIQNNILAGRYRQFQQFDEDMETMWSNSLIYNKGNNCMIKATNLLRKFYRKLADTESLHEEDQKGSKQK